MKNGPQFTPSACKDQPTIPVYREGAAIKYRRPKASDYNDIVQALILRAASQYEASIIICLYPFTCYSFMTLSTSTDRFYLDGWSSGTLKQLYGRRTLSQGMRHSELSFIKLGCSIHLSWLFQLVERNLSELGTYYLYTRLLNSTY